MKVCQIVLSLSFILWHSAVRADPLPLPAPPLPNGWLRIEIAEVGTIDIPPEMEVQSDSQYEAIRDLYGNWSDERGATSPGDIIIIQPQGQNKLDASAQELYARVIVGTRIVDPGDVAGLHTRFDATKDELRDLSNSMRAGLPATILEWSEPAVATVNGMQAIRFNFELQLADHPPVRVQSYLFQNYDRVHNLILFHRTSEMNKWSSDLQRVLKSFRITNIRGPSSPKTSVP